MPKMRERHLLIGASRNLFRRFGAEVVPVQAESSLLAMHLRLLFAKLNISCVLDVGARCGDFGLWLRRNGYRGEIISFEPVEANFADLARAAARDPKWHCFRYALGAEDGVAAINVCKFTQFSSFRQPNATAESLFGGTVEVKRTEKVAMRQLDSMVDTLPVKLDNRVYLKLDTQGWDLEVLRGARRALDRIVALQTEVAVQPLYTGMPTMRDSLAVVADNGFIPSGFFPVSIDPALALIEFDLVAVRSAWVNNQ